MNGEKRTTGNTREARGRYLSCGILCLFFVFLAVLFFVLKTSMSAILRAALYLPLGLLLPGYLLSRGAAGKNNSSELYGFSLLFGVGFSILSYFLDSFIRLPLLPNRLFSIFLGPVLSVPGFLLLLRDVRTGRRDGKSLLPDIRIFALIAVAEIITLGSMALSSALPAGSVDVLTAPNNDVAWMIANQASLNRGWPAETIQFMGKYFNRHCFADIFRVEAGRFIGVKSQAEMFYVFSCLFLLPLLVFALDSLGQSFADGDRKRSRLFIMVFLFVGYVSGAVLYFCNPAKALAAADAMRFGDGAANLLYCPNGIDLSFPGSALLILLIRRYFREENVPKAGLYLAVFAAAAITTGAKYVSTICVAGGIAGTMLIRLLQKKGIRSAARSLVPLVLVAAGLIPVYFGVVKGGKVYLPPTQQEAEYLRSDDPEYVQARKAYAAFLEDTYRAFALVRSADSAAETVVRQDTDGNYYVCGDGLSVTEQKRGTVSGIIGRADDLQTGGILGGAGGVYRADKSGNSLIRIGDAKGFVRYTEQDTGIPAVLFYGFKPAIGTEALDADTISTDPGLTAEGMFADGGDGTAMEYRNIYSAISINADIRNTKIYSFLQEKADVENSPFLPVILFLLIPVHFVLARPVTSIPFLCWMWERLKRFRTVRAEDLAAGGTAVCGLIAYYILNIDGASQRYFFETAVLVIDAAGICWLCAHFRGMRKFAKVLICLAAAVGLCTNWGLYAGRFTGGAQRAYTAMTTERSTETEPGWHITAYELEAMEWLRENTPEDAVVAVNRYYHNSRAVRSVQPIPNDRARYYYYDAYGERQAFLGSWAYMSRTARMQEMLRKRLAVNEALFDPMCANRREIMEANGISYLIASAEAGTGMYLPDRDLTCVFRNRDITIYMLNEAVPAQNPE